jgi:hypothetical protein
MAACRDADSLPLEGFLLVPRVSALQRASVVASQENVHSRTGQRAHEGTMASTSRARRSVSARRPIARVSNGPSRSGPRDPEHLVTVPATEETDIVHQPDVDDAQGAFTERTPG